MSASVLRQEDEYSAHVIEQTIKSVIPMLAASTDGQTAIDTVPIIAAFVANFDFIPKHRRLLYVRVRCADSVCLRCCWRLWDLTNIFLRH
jgi:hypothetical protein